MSLQKWISDFSMDCEGCLLSKLMDKLCCFLFPLIPGQWMLQFLDIGFVSRPNRSSDIAHTILAERWLLGNMLLQIIRSQFEACCLKIDLMKMPKR